MHKEAEVFAQQSVFQILEIAGDKYVFYVGATIYGLGSAKYVKEALACVLDSQRNPVLVPKDAVACSSAPGSAFCLSLSHSHCATKAHTSFQSRIDVLARVETYKWLKHSASTRASHAVEFVK